MNDEAFSLRSCFMHSVSVIKALAPTSALKKRAVGYARVSTEKELQETSYALQIEELTTFIKSNDNYIFLGVFKDKASGSALKERQDFTTMLELARAKEIDVIITKSISRFGRNLIETINVVRELRLLNVEIYFQKENISSLDDSFDFLFTLLASHAEEESNNIAENNHWSINKRKRQGDNLTSQLYGYKIINKEFTIVEDEAAVVRKVYELYLAKKTYQEIINYLHENNIKTRKGNDYWSRATLEGMLQNEKYTGDMILGKYFTKKGVKTVNKHGLVDVYLIENNHPPIISKETFLKAQVLRKSRHNHVSKDGTKKWSPYAKFVYSTAHNRYFRYSLEKPKGKTGNVTSIIPTIYCPGIKGKVKRLGFQTVVIVNLLNFVLSETRSNLLLLVLKTITALNERISNDHYLSDESFLVTRLSDLKALQKLNKIRKLLTVNRDYDIIELRVIFSKVIVKENAFHLKLNVTNDDSLALDSNQVIHETTYTFTKFYEVVSYPIYVYFRGSINKHGMK